MPTSQTPDLQSTSREGLSDAEGAHKRSSSRDHGAVKWKNSICHAYVSLADIVAERPSFMPLERTRSSARTWPRGMSGKKWEHYPPYQRGKNPSLVFREAGNDMRQVLIPCRLLIVMKYRLDPSLEHL